MYVAFAAGNTTRAQVIRRAASPPVRPGARCRRILSPPVPRGQRQLRGRVSLLRGRSQATSHKARKRLRGCGENALHGRAAFRFGSFRGLSSCCSCLFTVIALFSVKLRYISIKYPFLTKILTHSLYYGNRMQRVCPTSAALFRCGRGDSKNKQSLRQKRRRRTTTKIKEERT